MTAAVSGVQTRPLSPLYYRRLVARAWNVPPWVVDEAPASEVEAELQLMLVDMEIEKRRAELASKRRGLRTARRR